MKKLRRSLRFLLLVAVTLVWISACNGSFSERGTAISDPQLTECRIIQHAMGKTCVPANPKRVVALDPGSLGNTIALGIQPAGAAILDQELPAYLKERATAIEFLGHPNQPNLEKITLLKPDLILMDTRTPIYEQLSAIAPTVATADWDQPGSEALWKRDLKLHATALGKSQEAEVLLNDYDSRIQDLQQQLGDRLDQIQVSVVNFRPEHTRIYLKDSFIGTILQDVGLPRPPAQDKGSFIERISLEKISAVEGDVIFLIVSDPQETAVLQQFTQNPLWSRLKAVQENRVYQVSAETWINGWNILGANQVLDDLFRYLTPPV